MCVFWVAVTASLNFLFYSCCCFFAWCCDSIAFLNALKLCVCVRVCGGAVTACLSRFFLKLLRQHSLSKRIEVECMCVFWVAVTASLQMFFYSCCCFFNGAATALLF